MQTHFRHIMLVVLVVGLSGCTSWLRGTKPDYKTVEGDPHHDTHRAEKLNGRALAFMKRGKLDQAEIVLQNALIADITFGPAHNNLGRVYYLQKKFYLAAWEFEYAQKVMPERPEAFNNLGLVYEAAEKFDEAIGQYELANQYQPDHPEYIGNLARAHIRRGDKDWATGQLIERLIMIDTRPEWIAWAREQRALKTFEEKPAETESIKSPSGIYLDFPEKDNPQESLPLPTVEAAPTVLTPAKRPSQVSGVLDRLPEETAYAAQPK